MAEKSKGDPFGREVKLRAPLVQRDVAAWTRAYVQLPRVGAPEQWQAALAAGIVAGWFETPATSAIQQTDMATGATKMVYTFDGVDIEEMTAAEVRYYGTMMDAEYTRLTTVPKPKN